MRRLRWIIDGAAPLAILGVLMVVPVVEHWRTQSPDGAFTAVVRIQPFWLLLPAMPGGGSDKPARVTVYQDGRSCGSAWVELAWMARELEWQFDSRPRRARIKLVADWGLEDCTIQIVR